MVHPVSVRLGVFSSQFHACRGNSRWGAGAGHWILVLSCILGRRCPSIELGGGKSSAPPPGPKCTVMEQSLSARHVCSTSGRQKKGQTEKQGGREREVCSEVFLSFIFLSCRFFCRLIFLSNDSSRFLSSLTDAAKFPSRQATWRSSHENTHDSCRVSLGYCGVSRGKNERSVHCVGRHASAAGLLWRHGCEVAAPRRTGEAGHGVQTQFLPAGAVLAVAHFDAQRSPSSDDGDL